MTRSISADPDQSTQGRALRLDAPDRASLAFALILSALALLTAVFAAATYLVVERPMIALGGRIAGKIELRRAGALRSAT